MNLHYYKVIEKPNPENYHHQQIIIGDNCCLLLELNVYIKIMLSGSLITLPKKLMYLGGKQSGKLISRLTSVNDMKTPENTSKHVSRFTWMGGGVSYIQFLGFLNFLSLQSP